MVAVMKNKNFVKSLLLRYKVKEIKSDLKLILFRTSWERLR